MSLVDHFGHDSIRPSSKIERTMNGFNAFAIWCACAVVISVVMVGTLLIPNLSPMEAIAITVSGSLVGGLALALTGTVGSRTGLPTMVLMRAVFGQKGAVLPAVINGMLLIGWNWIQAFMAGFSLNYAVEHTFGYSNINLFVIITGVLVTAVAIYGHRGIERIENVVSIAMLLLSLVVFVQLFSSYDVAPLVAMKAIENPEISRVVAFDIVVGLGCTWLSSVCDYNRNCKSVAAGAVGTYLGYTLAAIVAITLGICVASFSIHEGIEMTYDPTVLLASSGYGVVAAIVVFLSVVSTNVKGTYSASFSFIAAFPKVTFWKICLIVGAVSIVGALLKDVLIEMMMDYVLLIGFMYIPMFSMLLVDFFLLNKGQYDAEDIATDCRGKYRFDKGFNVVAIAVYLLCAFGAYYFCYVQPLETGTTIPAFFVSGLVYFVVMKLFGYRARDEVRFAA